MTKQELLQKIGEEWEKLLASFALFDDDQKLQPRFIGEWSLKDLLGHISSWESVALERVGRMQRDEPIEFIPDDEVDAWNKKFWELRRGWKLIVVEGEFENVHKRLVEEIEKLPDEAWDKNAMNVCEWIPECTFVHYAEHRASVEKKHGSLTASPINEEPTS